MSTIDPENPADCDGTGVSMEQPKQWRVEVNDPRKTNRWTTVRGISDDELEAAEQERNELNKTNAPVLIRIVRMTHF